MKRITLAIDKRAAQNSDELNSTWHVDIQLRTKTQLIKWMLKRGETINLKEFRSIRDMEYSLS